MNRSARDEQKRRVAKKRVVPEESSSIAIPQATNPSELVELGTVQYTVTAVSRTAPYGYEPYKNDRILGGPTTDTLRGRTVNYVQYSRKLRCTVAISGAGKARKVS